MGPPIVWLASDEAAGVHDERIIAAEFERWLRDRKTRRRGLRRRSRPPPFTDARAVLYVR
jgi:hypothetical protein